jgi:hypothetical protein
MPQVPGVYSFSCTIAWQAAPGTVTQWEASLHWNMQRIFTSGDLTDGKAATRTVYGVMRLKKDEKVQCAAYQESSGSQPLNVEWAVTTFEGHRVALATAE